MTQSYKVPVYTESKQSVLIVSVFEVGEMGRCKDLSNLD